MTDRRQRGEVISCLHGSEALHEGLGPRVAVTERCECQQVALSKGEPMGPRLRPGQNGAITLNNGSQDLTMTQSADPRRKTQPDLVPRSVLTQRGDLSLGCHWTVFCVGAERPEALPLHLILSSATGLPSAVGGLLLP